LPSEDAQVYEVIPDPPFAGADQEILSWLTCVVAVGAEGVAGTVVIVTAPEAEDAAEVPAALVAVTVNVGVAVDAIPVTVNGEDAPVAVCPVLAVTVKDVALGESAGKEKETDAAPSLNALPVPMFVAETPVGAKGSKKSFDACDFLPILLPDAMFNLLISY
jgi:hypothetical protein